jgi:glycosyltransferase involved in cell wall biosynthesis
MRILLTVHQFLPDYTSGTEILALHSALELKSRGHEVEVMTALPVSAVTADRDRFDSYEHEGIRVTRFRHAHVPTDQQGNVAELEYNNLLVAERFGHLARQFRPDVVHFFHLMRLSASVVDVCRRLGLPTVLTPTDFWLICPMCQLRLPDGTACAGPDTVAANCVRHVVVLKGPAPAAALLEHLPDPLLRCLVRLARSAPLRRIPAAAQVAAVSRRGEFLRERLRQIDRVLVPTRAMYEILLRHGLDPSRARLCGYGIRLPARAARSGRGSAQPLTVGLIGLGAHKGAHVLVQSVRRLGNPAMQARIYGRRADFPDYVQRLEELAAGDARIRLCGTFPNDRIGEVVSELDLLVVPSLWFENAPLVIHTAQALGCPVVGSDMPGIAELITHGENGLLFPPGDADALAAILARLAGDRDELAALSARARPPKSIEEYVDDLLAEYATAAGTGKAIR